MNKTIEFLEKLKKLGMVHVHQADECLAEIKQAQDNIAVTIDVLEQTRAERDRLQSELSKYKLGTHDSDYPL